MDILSRLFKGIIFSNILVSFCALSLVISSQIMSGSYNKSISLFVFFSTLSTYNFQRIIHVENITSKERKRWICKNKSLIYILIVFSALISLYYFIYLNRRTQIAIFLAGSIAILYPFGLRRVPFLKIFLICGVWTIVTSLIIMLEDNISIKQNEFLHLAARFAFVFAITIPFDIRDMRLDHQKLKTIPILIGENISKIMSYSLLIISTFIYGLLLHSEHIAKNHLIGIIITFLITSTLISQATPKRDEKYFSFWIESTSIIFCLILILSSWIV